MEIKRYILQPSKTIEDGYVVTDTQSGLVVTFVRYRFNETQQATLLHDSKFTDPRAIARLCSELADWLVETHPELIFADSSVYTDAEPLVTRELISEYIRESRLRQGLSIEECAEVCGLSKNHIWRIEQGKYGYTIDTLLTVLHALGHDLQIVDRFYEIEDENEGL